MVADGVHALLAVVTVELAGHDAAQRKPQQHLQVVDVIVEVFVFRIDCGKVGWNSHWP